MSEIPPNAFRIEIEATLVNKSVSFEGDGPTMRLEYDDGAILLLGFEGSFIAVTSPNRHVAIDAEERVVRVTRS